MCKLQPCLQRRSLWEPADVMRELFTQRRSAADLHGFTHTWRSGRAQDTQSVKTTHLFIGHYVVGYSTMSTLRVVCMSQEWPLHDWCAPAETCY